jgi:hypothetical protein
LTEFIKAFVVVIGAIALLSFFFSLGQTETVKLTRGQTATFVIGNDFNGLIDVPDSYAGFAGYCVAINSDENGVDFIACAAASTDSNFNTFPDFNKWYVSWIDGNRTYYKQADLNKLLQIPDFNDMIINLGQAQGWHLSASSDGNFYSIPDFNDLFMKIPDANAAFARKTDINGTYVKIVDGNVWYVRQVDGNLWFAKTADVNAALALRALTTDLNGGLDLKADILDVNAADALRLLLQDLNDFAGIYHEAVADWNNAVKYAVDWNSLDFNFGVIVNAPWLLLNDVNSFDINWGVIKGAPWITAYVDTNIFSSGVSDCPAGQYVYGFNSNGTIDCRADVSGSGGGSYTGVNDVNVNNDTNTVGLNADFNASRDARYLTRADQNDTSSFLYTVIALPPWLTQLQLNAWIPWADVNVADDITLTNITQVTNRSLSDLQDKNFSLLALDSNVNLDSRYSKITDTNAADSQRLLISDLNDSSSIAWQAINFVNAVLSLIEKLSVKDLNVGSGKIGSNDLNYALTDLNYSVRSECNGDVNSVLTSAGLCQDITNFHLSGGAGGGASYTGMNDVNVDTDLNKVGLNSDFNLSRDLRYLTRADFNERYDERYSKPSDVNAELNKKANITDVNGSDTSIRTDMNAWFWKIIDLNALFSFKLNLFDLNVGRDLNITRDLNVSGKSRLFDLNVTHDLNVSNNAKFDKNVTVQTVNSKIDIADKNTIYIGSNPADRICIKYADGNFTIGAC